MRGKEADDRPLIVSYSYSGNTHRIARELQRATQGDWCEIYPWQPYPMAFPELLRQVKREVKAQYCPRLLPIAHRPQPYAMILIGSPSWCGTIAPPMVSWLHQNDLSGKVILPFYSHCGGATGDIRRDIARLCPRADVGEAISIIGDGGENLTEMVRKWLERNGSVGLDRPVRAWKRGAEGAAPQEGAAEKFALDTGHV